MNTFPGKPIPAVIHLPLANKDNDGGGFIGLSSTLYNQNLIYPEPRELRRKGCTLKLIVTFRDREAFNNWLSNDKIIEYWEEKFSNQLLGNPSTVEKTDVIVEVDNVENCLCSSSEFYILQGRSLQFMDELTCGTCLKQISYSRIPIDIELKNWQLYHQRFYLNWLDSGIFEQDALKELTNYKEGKLNLEAERIRKQLAEHFNAPVYIQYFVEESDENKICLICGDPGVDSGLNSPSKVCKNCNTIFD